MEGNIIVDGVLASCYPSADHDVLHVVLSPLRWFPQIIQWIMGEENGFQTYIVFAADIARWVLPDVQSFDDIWKVMN